MIPPHHSQLSSIVWISHPQRKLPSGKGFGGSNLRVVGERLSAIPTLKHSVLILDRTPATRLQESSPLVLEAGKIVVLSVWLWCAIGANFCSNSINSIACSFAPDSQR